MAWNTNTDFIPATMDELFEELRIGVNREYNTNYRTAQEFMASNWYRLNYPVLQLVRNSQVLFAEITAKMKDYIRNQNQKVLAPITTHDGMVEYFSVQGFTASVGRYMGGNLMVAIDTDPDASNFQTEIKPKILNMLSKCWTAGVWPVLTSPNPELLQRGTVALANGQSLEFAFYTPHEIATKIKLEITVSRNFQGEIDDAQTAKEKLIKNLKDYYRLGLDFEPEKYFSIERDAPYAAEIKLSYCEYPSTEFIAEIRNSTIAYEKLTFVPEDIEVIIV